MGEGYLVYSQVIGIYNKVMPGDYSEVSNEVNWDKEKTPGEAFKRIQFADMLQEKLSQGGNLKPESWSEKLENMLSFGIGIFFILAVFVIIFQRIQVRKLLILLKT